MSDAANPDAAPFSWRQKLKSEWLLLLFGTLTIALALFDPQPLANYQHWLQLPTLAGLMGLLIAIQGFATAGWCSALPSASPHARIRCVDSACCW
jgi:hypothetical protein